MKRHRLSKAGWGVVMDLLVLVELPIRVLHVPFSLWVREAPGTVEPAPLARAYAWLYDRFVEADYKGWPQ